MAQMLLGQQAQLPIPEAWLTYGVVFIGLAVAAVFYVVYLAVSFIKREMKKLFRSGAKIARVCSSVIPSGVAH